MKIMPMKVLPLVLLLGAFSLAACAQDNAAAASPGAKAAGIQATGAEARARAALAKLDPDMPIERVGPAPVAGFQQVIVGGDVVYISNDGKYLMQGTLYDIDGKRDAGEVAMATLRKELMREMPIKDRIVFAPPKPKYTITVFTDVECGYCRKMHSEIADYMKQGIAVEYVAFPRMGLGSADYKKMIAVWCADDRKQALTLAKLDKPVADKDCKNPVAQQYRLGQRMGLEGTPMLLAADGTQLGGYLPPAQLRAALDKLATR